MPNVTPHTLRRTFASILAECGVAPRRAMYLLGHTDAKLTLSVYRQVLDMSGDAVETLEQVLGGDLDDIGELLNGRTRRRRRTTEQGDAADDALLALARSGGQQRHDPRVTESLREDYSDPGSIDLARPSRSS